MHHDGHLHRILVSPAMRALGLGLAWAAALGALLAVLLRTFHI